MKRLLCVLSAVFVFSIGGTNFLSAASSVTVDTPPTFTNDVAPILFEKCIICHRPGEIAPMSLQTYGEVRPWARGIREKVLSGEMPPWHADPAYGTFRNDRSLTEEQIDTIVAWVDAGAPKGSDADLPKLPAFVASWQGGEPDHVIESVEFVVPPEGQLDTLNFWVPVPFTEDRFAEALELRPGNTSVVHHLRADLASIPEGSRIVEGILILSDGTPEEVDKERRANRTSDNTQLLSYVPGRGLQRYPTGTGKRIAAGKHIMFNQHYQPTGRPERDQSKLGLWFSQAPATHEVYMRGVGSPLKGTDGTSHYIVEGEQHKAVGGQAGWRGFPNIPPFEEDYRVVGITPVTEPITVYGFSPHMHLRGKDMSWMLTWPDGREQVLLRIPNYHFEWQIHYELEEPLAIPVGSTITSVAHYDNSVKNRYNPAPHKEVYWDSQSWDEMFIPYMEYTLDREDPLKRDMATQDQQP